MSKIFWIMLALINIVCLTACRDRQDGDLKAYLMLHPRMLSEEMVACQATDVSREPTAHCRVVIDTASVMMSMIEDHQRNPQAFGQRVLDAEMLYAKTGKNQEEVKTLLAVVGLSSPE